jgi:hypothetical protein
VQRMQQRMRRRRLFFFLVGSKARADELVAPHGTVGLGRHPSSSLGGARFEAVQQGERGEASAGGAGGNCRRLMRDDEGKLLEASFPSSSWIVSLLSSSGDADRASAGVSLSSSGGW